MPKKFFSFLLILILLIFPLPALGTDITVINNQVTISGQAGAGQWVSLMAEREDGKKSYINQVRSSSDGSYQFRFSLDRGRYNAETSADGLVQPLPLIEVNSDLGQTGGNGGGGDGGSPVPLESIALVSIRGDTQTGVILDNASWNWSGSCTALAALKGVLNRQGISYNISGEYVKSIAGLAEKKEGYPLSGWVFRINGVFSGVGAGSAIIRNGDRIEWLYTLDGGKDVGAVIPIGTKPGQPKEEENNKAKDSTSKLEEESLTINQQVDKIKQQRISFPDLDAGCDWAREAIESLATKGIIKGTGRGYEPYRNISRAEMVALLLKAKGISLETGELKYIDTRADDWYYEFVVTADKWGWVSGYPDSSFRPYAPISRNETVCLVNRVFPADNKEIISSKIGFSDQDNIPAWTRETVDNLQQRGIISGYPDGSFRGEGKLTRAEAAVIVYRLIRK